MCAADLLTCTEVTGEIYSVDAANPGTCSVMDPSKTMIAIRTGASINGRLYAQTAVTLEMNAVTKPN